MGDELSSFQNGTNCHILEVGTSCHLGELSFSQNGTS